MNRININLFACLLLYQLTVRLRIRSLLSPPEVVFSIASEEFCEAYFNKASIYCVPINKKKGQLLKLQNNNCDIQCCTFIRGKVKPHILP